MSERKTPILLRRGPLTGEVSALYRYTWKGDHIISSSKQSVQADYDALVLEELLGNGAEGVMVGLDGATRGIDLTDAERAEVGVLRARLEAMIARHNERNA